MTRPLTISEVVDAIRKSRECSMAEAKALHDEFMFERIELVKDAVRKELRDEFATAAMQGIVANGSYSFPDTVAVRAYRLADEMLVARKS